VSWQLLGYARACVVTPLAWGLVIVWVSNRMDRRLVRRRPQGVAASSRVRSSTTS